MEKQVLCCLFQRRSDGFCIILIWLDVSFLEFTVLHVISSTLIAVFGWKSVPNSFIRIGLYPFILCFGVNASFDNLLSWFLFLFHIPCLYFKTVLTSILTLKQFSWVGFVSDEKNVNSDFSYGIVLIYSFHK